jgi:D-glycero-alpha-D-manno-heptose-7-phosphate kinase
VDEAQHAILREAIKMLEFRTPQIEITTMADIPAGTGLGSSGTCRMYRRMWLLLMMM